MLWLYSFEKGRRGEDHFFSLGLSALRHFNLYDPSWSLGKGYLLGFAAPNFGGANYAFKIAALLLHLAFFNCYILSKVEGVACDQPASKRSHLINVECATEFKCLQLKNREAHSRL